MSRQYQNQDYQSGHYQTSYPYPPKQHGQIPQSLPDIYTDRPLGQHRDVHPSYPESSLQHPPSGQRHASRSPYAESVPIPEPQWGGSAGQPQVYIPPSQITPNSTAATHHHERRGSHGHPPTTASSSDSHRLYATGGPSESQWGGSVGQPQVYIPPPPNLTGATHHRHERRGSHGHSSTAASSSDSNRLYAASGSYTGGSSNFYTQPGVQPHQGRGYPASDMQSQDWDAAEYEGSDFRAKGPSGPPFGNHRQAQCRLPGCNRPVFFDRRFGVNQLREWCSEDHMQAAIDNRVEKPCKTCGIWPRRNGYKYCSVDYCRYPSSQYY